VGRRISGTVLVLVLLSGLGLDPAATAARPAAAPASPSVLSIPLVAAPSRASVTTVTSMATAAAGGFLAAATSPGQAVAAAAAQAARTGTTEFISVVDRRSGAVLAQTGNAGSQVGSESIFKLFLATYYLLIYGGYASTPDSVESQLSYMLRYSDDPTANNLFSANAVPTVAARYGLGATVNSTDRIGHWGATRITARDMTSFLFRAGRDPLIGPWLLPVLAQVAPTGSDGFNQHFGLNALSGPHGSKQGWGCDSYFTGPSCAIHSVGYTGSYFVAVLQLAPGSGYPDPMRANATNAATTIAASGVAPPPPPPPPAPRPLRPLRDGDFVRDPAGAIYRLAGGAPIYVSNWAGFGGPKPWRQLTAAQFAALRPRPADGTFIQGGRYTYQIAGGAPVFVSAWANVGGLHPVTVVDPVALDRSGSGGVYRHLAFRPADGTFIQGDRFTYRMAGGAPLFVATWSTYGGAQPVTVLDRVAVDHAGVGGVYSHLGFRPADGTELRAIPTSNQYVVRGGVARSAGVRSPTYIDQQTITRAGTGGVWNHLARG